MLEVITNGIYFLFMLILLIIPEIEKKIANGAKVKTYYGKSELRFCGLMKIECFFIQLTWAHRICSIINQRVTKNPLYINAAYYELPETMAYLQLVSSHNQNIGCKFVSVYEDEDQIRIGKWIHFWHCKMLHVASYTSQTRSRPISPRGPRWCN